jgi:ribosome-binding factor A
MGGSGVERMQELIRAKVATMLLRDLADPRLGMVTVSKVRLSADLERCVVYWSTLDEGKKRALTDKALTSARGYVQREVAGMLHTRKAPRLEFEFDPSIEGAARVTGLIDRAAADDAERRRAAGDAADASPPPDADGAKEAPPPDADGAKKAPPPDADGA